MSSKVPIYEMASKTLIWLLGVLLVIEVFSVFIVRWTASRQGRILQRHLGGRTMEILDESEREQVLSSVAAEYDRTVHRKIELLVIAFHIPALATSGLVTRQSTTPPLYYHGVTIAFWLALSVGLIKVFAKVRGAE